MQRCTSVTDANLNTHDAIVKAVQYVLTAVVCWTTWIEKTALLTIYFQPVDVIGRAIANKGRINGVSLKAAGSLLPGHSLITVSLAFALIGGNKGAEVE